MEPSSEKYSLSLEIYSRLVGEKCGKLMKENRDMLKSLDLGKIPDLIKVLKDEDYITGVNPQFLNKRQLGKFFSKIIQQKYDSAINYVQTFSGQSGQIILNDLLRKRQDISLVPKE